MTQRGEQDRRLLALEDELRRLEAKLLSAVRERTGLTASGTTLERQLSELKKANEFLKNKVCLSLVYLARRCSSPATLGEEQACGRWTSCLESFLSPG